ncbi:MAG: hypothetical protein ACOY37_11195 [Pseudomonadota bacterium]
MSLPWSAQQLEWLREMGLDVFARRVGDGPALPVPADGAVRADASLPASPMAEPGPGGDAPRMPLALERIAHGVDLAPLLALHPPRDPASRRALWRALRPLRKAARRR